MHAESLTYWLAGICPPVAACFLNVIVRGKDALKSSGADWALLVLAFDGTAAIAAADLAKNIPNVAMREYIPSITPALIFLSLLLWVVIVIWIEPKIKIEAGNAKDWLVKVAAFGFAWVLVITNLFAHFYLFVPVGVEHG